MDFLEVLKEPWDAIVSDYVVGFFEKYLMGRSPERFDGLAARYPDVEITRRGVP